MRYTDLPLHTPKEIYSTEEGIYLVFTNPLDAESASDIENYDVRRWGYRRTADYGSRDYKVSNPRKLGQDRVRVTQVDLAEDRQTLLLRIPDMQPSMQVEIRYEIFAEDGTKLSNRIQSTINRIGSNRPAALTD